MADFNKLKDTIRGAIYPNGRGAISADKHQAALLDMADTMQETAAQVTELSEEIKVAQARAQVLDFTIYEINNAIEKNGGAIDRVINKTPIINALKNNTLIVIPIGAYSDGYCVVQGELDSAGTLSIEFDYSGFHYSAYIESKSIEADKEEIGSNIVIDEELSSTSTNPVQNKVIESKFSSVLAENERLKERIDEQDIFIEDLQDMKIDRENDDYYPKMAVGLADNLAGVDVVDSEINFRRSGGGAISDGVARIETIKGNSVVWNQGIYNSNFAEGLLKWEASNTSLTINADGSIRATNKTGDSQGIFQYVTMPCAANHKVLVIVDFQRSDLLQTSVIVYLRKQQGGYDTSAAQISSVNRERVGLVIQTTDIIEGVRIYPFSYGHIGSYCDIYGCYMYDLTKMFGVGNEPTTIEEFNARKPLGIDESAYNEGEVIHMDVQSIESQGVNAWDEEWEIGIYDSDNGKKVNGGAYDNQIRSKEPFAIIPNTEYYVNIPNKASGLYMAIAVFLDKNKNYISKSPMGPSAYQKVKTPSNACYMVFTVRAEYGTTYNNDICINLSDASINGKYFPHIKRVEDLAVIRKYFPNGMRSAGTAHDEIRYNKASGKWEKVQRIGEVNLGSLVWSYNSTSGQERFYSFGVSDLAPIQNDGTKANLLCAKYDTKPFSEIFAHIADKTIGMHSSGQVVIYDTAYTDAASFKAAMQGVILYYELAEPIVTELDNADQYKDLDYQVWNAGTEKAIAEGKSVPLAADITYGFNAPAKIKENANEIAKLKQSSGSTTTYKTINGTSVVGSGNIDTHYPISSSTASALTIQPNTYYKWSGATLNVTLGSTDANICEFVIELAVTGTPTITFPSSVKWANGIAPTFVSGKSYIVSIVNNLGVYAAF